MEEETEATAIMMASLATLSLPQLSDLTNSIFTQTHQNHLRLASLLSSPPLFSLTLNRLHSLSLPHKTHLIARHLLSSLRHLTLRFQPPSSSAAFSPSAAIGRRDLDAVLLLLFLCEVRQHSPEALRSPPSEWRRVLCKLYAGNMLRVSGGGGGIGVYDGTAALVPFIETVTRCLRFVGLMGGCGGGGGGAKVGKDVPASVPAVVALPSVEVSGGGGLIECAICKDEMVEGRDVCELPCQHVFHWMCILPWLRKKNTCPCCRFQLPTDDVFGEIQRLWEVLVLIGGKSTL